MPFWPFFMGAAAALALWGWRLGAWQVPVLVLLTYCVVRAIVMSMPEMLHEVAICAAWLAAGAVMLSLRAWVPGFFYILSGLTYPAFLVFGVRLQYLGASAILAEIFAILALLSIGGGLYGLAAADRPSRADGAGILHRLPVAALGVAAR